MARDAIERPAGVAEARAGHHGERHRADCAAGPGVDAGGGGTRSNAASPSRQEAERHERVADVQDQDERVARRAVAGPARQPRACSSAGDQQARRRSAACAGARSRRERGRARRDRRPRRSGRTAPAARPGFSRASQLRVKLGTMRPPISVISSTTAAMPSADAVVGRAGEVRFEMKRDVAGRQQADERRPP